MPGKEKAEGRSNVLEQALFAMAGKLESLDNTQVLEIVTREAPEVISDLESLKGVIGNLDKPSGVIPVATTAAIMLRMFVMTDSSDRMLRFSEKYGVLSNSAIAVLDRVYPLVGQEEFRDTRAWNAIVNLFGRERQH